MTATELAFAPLLPWAWIAGLAALILAGLILAAMRMRRGVILRGLAAAVVLTALANPSIIRESRTPVQDVAVVVADRSPSMQIAERRQQMEQALADLRVRLGAEPGLEVRVIEAGTEEGRLDETRLFGALDSAIADIPRRRLAGVILLSDGQIHDVPDLPATEDGAPDAAASPYGPVHLLVAGQRDEPDRRLSLVEAPAFGLVGQSVTLRFRVDDLPGGSGESVPLSVTLGSEEQPGEAVQEGIEQTIEVPIEHRGQNLIELQVPPLPGERALANNRLAVVVQGVRDRLRVLLVSGEPHNGGRTWRNLLKSDPSVDLVHFTILRPPDAQDLVRQEELSLIAFPVSELFETKLYEFDLIIFDRYRQRQLLEYSMFNNMVDYVRKGGAMLIAGGPETVGPNTLFATALAEILPGQPRGALPDDGYRPQVTEMGLRHPVTAGLPGANETPEAAAQWGRWFSQAWVALDRGMTLMTGVENQPLLVLDRVEEGRVALLASDQVWLWSRGFEGGGPQAELLRRLAHWLMKEPELEEKDLRARVDQNLVVVERRDIDRQERPVTVTRPDETEEPLPMQEVRPGVWEGRLQSDTPGVFRFGDGERTAIAVVGRVNPPELTDTAATVERVKPLQAVTDGGSWWLQDGLPQIRRIDPDRGMSGSGWLGLRANQDYTVDRVLDVPLLPAAAVLFLVVALLMGGWFRESR